VTARPRVSKTPGSRPTFSNRLEASVSAPRGRTDIPIRIPKRVRKEACKSWARISLLRLLKRDMSALGPTEKNSVRADVFRSSPENGHPRERLTRSSTASTERSHKDAIDLSGPSRRAGSIEMRQEDQNPPSAATGSSKQDITKQDTTTVTLFPNFEMVS
jgi:hypothetical protein